MTNKKILMFIINNMQNTKKKMTYKSSLLKMIPHFSLIQYLCIFIFISFPTLQCFMKILVPFLSYFVNNICVLHNIHNCIIFIIPLKFYHHNSIINYSGFLGAINCCYCNNGISFLIQLLQEVLKEDMESLLNIIKKQVINVLHFVS